MIIKASLIFDSANDLVFGTWNSNFINCMKTFGVQESHVSFTPHYKYILLMSSEQIYYRYIFTI